MNIAGIREKLNESPAVVTAIAAGLILLTLIFAATQLGLFGSGLSTADDIEVFVSEDYQGYREGTAADLLETGPDGQPIAQAYVFRYPGGEPWVWYYERLSPALLQARARLDSGSATLDEQAELGAMAYDGREVMDPDAGRWVPMLGEEGTAIAQQPPPDAQGRPAEPVRP